MIKWPRTLQARLLITYLVLIVLSIGILVWRLGTWLDESRLAETRRDQEGRAILAASATEEMLVKFGENVIDAQGLTLEVMALSERISERMLILDDSGHMLVDSGKGRDDRVTTSLPPEIEAAINGSVMQEVRFDAAEGGESLYTAAPVYHDHDLIGIVWLDLPMSAVAAERSQRWLQIAAAALLAAFATVLVSLWFARTITSPIARITQAATSMAGGDLKQRIQITVPEEVAKLGNVLNHMAEQVSVVVENQRAFVANAAHELRTPLTTIRLRAEALRDGAQQDHDLADKFLAEIEGETDRLSRVVDGLLDLCRIESGVTAPQREPISLPDIAQTAVERLQERAKAAAVSITVLSRKPVPVVSADPDQMLEVYLNLIGNSIKFTRPGGAVQVEFSVNGPQVVSRVCDSGEGIPAQDLPHIFERFYRSDKARIDDSSDGHGGAGLGLAIVKGIIEAHAGTVWAESDSGKGTIISFALPL